MTIDYRIRNIVIAAALAAAAVLLTVIYVTSAKDDEAAGRKSVTVYVPTKSFAIGALATRSLTPSITHSLPLRTATVDMVRSRPVVRW